MAVSKAPNGKWRVDSGKPVYKSKKKAEKVDRVKNRMKKRKR